MSPLLVVYRAICLTFDPRVGLKSIPSTDKLPKGINGFNAGPNWSQIMRGSLARSLPRPFDANSGIYTLARFYLVAKANSTPT